MHKCVNVVSPGISDLCEFHSSVRVYSCAADPCARRVPLYSLGSPIERPIPPRETGSRSFLPDLLNRPLNRGRPLSFDDRSSNRGFWRSAPKGRQFRPLESANESLISGRGGRPAFVPRLIDRKSLSLYIYIYTGQSRVNKQTFKSA